MSQRIFDKQRSVVITTNATLTRLLTYTLPPANCVFQFESNIQAHDGLGNGLVSKKIAVGIRYPVSNLDIIVQDLTPILVTAGFSTAVITISKDEPSNEIRVDVTGIAATTIEWMCDLHIWIN